MNKQALVYEIDWLIDLIYKESDKLIYKITDTTRFEERCINDLANYLAKCESNRKHRRHLFRTVKRYVKEAEEWFKKEESTLLSEITHMNEDGEEVGFEPIDVLADVESEVMAKEMTALLAQDDHRNETIVKSWVDGNTNIASISRLLAQSIGGNAKSHRVHIHRFRQSCQEEMRNLLEAI